MEIKKKNFLENLRLKTKLVNLKKPGKKAISKQGRKLAHRRSISVPDLRFVPGEAFSSDSNLAPTPSDAIYFGNSPGRSDTDSVASGSIADGPLYTDKPSDSVPDYRLRVPTGRTNAALNRVSAPVGLNCYEEIDGVINSRSQNKVAFTQEGLYAQVDKRPKENAARFTFDPIAAPRSVFPKAPSPRPDHVERQSLSGEDAPGDRVRSGTVAALLARASSMGDQINPYTDKRTTSFEPRKSSSEKGTPPTIRVNAPAATSLMLGTLCTPAESADGTSLDSACGSPTEERVNMPWTTDSEELDRELYSPFLMREFVTEETLLEQAQAEEAWIAL